MADLSYEPTDTASIASGLPAKSSKVLNIFNDIKDYINAAIAWVDSKHIVNGAVDTVHIADLNVTTAKIADGNVTTVKIADGNVTTDKILDANVTTAKIADDNVTTDKILDANVTEAKLDTGAVTADKIDTGAVTEVKIDTGAVTETKIGDGAVTVNKLGAEAVQHSKIGVDAVRTVNILDGAVTEAKLAAAVAAMLVPTGSVSPYAGTAAPTGWLLCDGSAVSRSTYSALFAVTSDTFGVGNGTTTFNLPDLRGKMPLGVSGSYALAATGGAATVTLTSAQSGLPAHTHTTNISEGSGGHDDATPRGDHTADRSGTIGVEITTDANSAANAASAHENLPPYVALNYIIKY